MTTPGSSHEITQLLEDWSRGNDAALDAVIDMVYDDLCRIAHRHLGGEREGHTLDTSALVHESYLRLMGKPGFEWRNRAQFFAVVSRAMRRILVDHARRRRAEKRGGDGARLRFTDGLQITETDLAELLALDDALDRLGALSPRLIHVVECRFFGGLTVEETAASLGVSRRSVERDWTRARTYLFQALDAPASPPPSS